MHLLCRSCWTSGCSYSATTLQRDCSFKHITQDASHKEAALVWKASNQVISEFAEVTSMNLSCKLFLYRFYIFILTFNYYNCSFIIFRNTALGKFFFKSVATSEAVKSILCQVNKLKMHPVHHHLLVYRSWKKKKKNLHKAKSPLNEIYNSFHL